MRAQEEKVKIENAIKAALFNENLKVGSHTSSSRINREERRETNKPLYLVRYE
jgi:hypothetical protein